MRNSPSYHRIGIVGTGRVASTLALALQSRSDEPVTMWGRNPAMLDAARHRIQGIATSSDLSIIPAQCDLIAIAVADDAIAPLVAAIGALPLAGHAPFAFHVSGRSGATILEPLRTIGMRTAAIHPAMTFTGDPQTECARMAGAHFAVTGADTMATEEAVRLVGMLGGIPVPVAEAHRPLYHAGLCHAANHLVTLIDGACAALSAAGVAAPLPFLAPLVRAALDNSLARGFDALSGPLLRGDTETIANHLVAIENSAPDLAPAYRAMAGATLDRLERAGHVPETAIRGMLGDEGLA